MCILDLQKTQTPLADTASLAKWQWLQYLFLVLHCSSCASRDAYDIIEQHTAGVHVVLNISAQRLTHLMAAACTLVRHYGARS